MSTPRYSDLPPITHTEAYAILSRFGPRSKELTPSITPIVVKAFERKMPARFKFERMRYHYPNLYYDHDEV